MAKDDYYVIVYQILSYLYQKLKKGEPVDTNALKNDGALFNISKSYWAYILYHMYSSGLVENITFVELDGMDYPCPCNYSKCRITPLGIGYLCDNTLIEKAKRFLKDVKEIAPFI